MQALTTRAALMAGLLLALPLLALWATGSLGAIAAWAAAGQREAQEAMAGAVRAIRSGAPGAVATLLGICLAYGLFHAAGPGHGKVLIGGYGMARRVPFLRLAGLAVASSLAQATVAVLMVGTLVAVLNWTRVQVVGAAEGAMVTAGHLAVAAVGLWLIWRGARGLARAGGVGAHHKADHAHHAHDDHPHDCTCNHAHGPTIEEVAALSTWREAAALIAGIAIRPCSGALFLLIVTWQMGIFAAGVAGTYAMGLGTALVTTGVAGLSVWAREGTLAMIAPRRLSLALPALEMGIGVVVVALSLTLAAGTV